MFASAAIKIIRPKDTLSNIPPPACAPGPQASEGGHP